ncbi:MAG: hypothetical protein ACLGGX_09655 [Bdellovibrionia bacterium]
MSKISLSSFIILLLVFGFSFPGYTQSRNSATQSAADTCYRTYGGGQAYVDCINTRGGMRNNTQAWHPDNPIVQSCERSHRRTGGNAAVDSCIRNSMAAQKNNEAKKQNEAKKKPAQTNNQQIAASCTSNSQCQPGVCMSGRCILVEDHIREMGDPIPSVCQKCGQQDCRTFTDKISRQVQNVICIPAGVASRSNSNAPQDPDAIARNILQVCRQQTQAEYQKCTTENSEALKTCDADKNSDMGQVMDSAAELTLALGAQTGGSVAAACSKAAKLSQVANGALAAYRFACKSDRDACVNSCQGGMAKFSQCVQQQRSQYPILANYDFSERINSDNTYKELSSSRTECNALQSKIQQAEAAAGNIYATYLNAKQCKNLTTSPGEPDPTVEAPPTFCAANPSSPMCAGQANLNCSSPENANNLACICMANKNDPRCGGLNAKAQGDLNVGGYRDPASKGRNEKLDFGSSNGGLQLPGKTGDNANVGQDNKPGGSPNLGGGGGSGGFGDEGGSGDGASEGVDVNAGFFGAGGSGGGFGEGGFGGGGGDNPDMYNGLTAGEPAPDLKDFLPGGMNDPSAMTGEGLPEGINGPNTNIWHKINYRYQVVEPSLLK